MSHRFRGSISSSQKSAKAGWIFSRAEKLLLSATVTTSEMPGGMKPLNHGNSVQQFIEISNKKYHASIGKQFSTFTPLRNTAASARMKERP
jgi:hypothetical protein